MFPAAFARVCPFIAPFHGARSSGVEHLTFNQRVAGSIPAGLTILSDGLGNPA